jgi:DNA repair protein RadC
LNFSLINCEGNGQYRPARAEEVLSQARRVLSQRVRRGATMSSPQAVKDDLRVEVGALEHEVFSVLFLDAQHRIIALKQMFRGTVTQTSVYPREVVKEALGLNAAAVLLVQDRPASSRTTRRAVTAWCQSAVAAMLRSGAGARPSHDPRVQHQTLYASPVARDQPTGKCGRAH